MSRKCINWKGRGVTFLPNVSHELRTPLTVLQGYLEMMDEQPLGGAVREKALAHHARADPADGRAGEAVANAVEN